MAYFSATDRMVTVRVVYWGPPHSGKATNLQRIQEVLAPDGEAEVVPIESAGEEALLFQSPPIALDMDPPCWLRVHVSTVTGDTQDPLTRRALLRDVDGIVFVADARRERFRANLTAWTDLLEHLRCLNLVLAGLPMVMQYNQRDRDGCMETADLDSVLNSEQYPSFEGVAVTGRGVGKCFSEIVRRIGGRVFRDLQLDRHGYKRGAFTSALDTALLSAASNVRRTESVEGLTEPAGEDELPPVAQTGSDLEAGEDLAPAPVCDEDEAVQPEPEMTCADPDRTDSQCSDADCMLDALADRCRDLEEAQRELIRAVRKARAALSAPVQELEELLETLNSNRAGGLDLDFVAGRASTVLRALEENVRAHLAEDGGALHSAFAQDRECNLEVVLDQVVRQLRPELMARNVDVRIGKLRTLKADRRLIALLFRRLFDTLLEHSVHNGAGSTIHVAAKSADRGYLMELRERGPREARTGSHGDRESEDSHMPRLRVEEEIVALHGGQLRARWDPDAGVVVRLGFPRSRVLNPGAVTR